MAEAIIVKFPHLLISPPPSELAVFQALCQEQIKRETAWVILNLLFHQEKVLGADLLIGSLLMSANVSSAFLQNRLQSAIFPWMGASLQCLL